MTLTPISSRESARKKFFINSTYIMSRKWESNSTYIMSRKWESNVFGLRRLK